MERKNKRLKEEPEYFARCRLYRKKIYFASERSTKEGFSEIEQRGITDETGRRVKTRKGNMLLSLPKSSMIKMLRIMMRWMPRIAEGRRKSLSDLSCYFQELDHFNHISAGHSWSESYPNRELWEDIADYAYSKWKCKIGFTHVPKELIFKDRGILFEHAIVVIMEMDKNKIDQAPAADAGEEAYRIYAVLGEAVNDIANRLRTVHQIKCQSHHPLGGLVNDSALASKAGLGWQGSNGLLVTPEYGQRQRIASIFIREKVFPYTDSDKHRWIEQFCESCRACVRACPAEAVYRNRKIAVDNVEGIGALRTCINRDKCYRYFEKTLGCSVCVKVCPFSRETGAYAKIKQLLIQGNDRTGCEHEEESEYKTFSKGTSVLRRR